MIGQRLLALLVVLLLLPLAHAGTFNPFGKRTRSEAQVKRLIDTVRNDPDEKKRHAALIELQEVDPRAHADVIPALIAVLQTDAVPQLRGEAAEAIGQYKLVFATAGLALEAAAELDPVKSVRASAQQALWEYHLAGYRSPRGTGGIAGQTEEPPLARPKSKVAMAAVVTAPPSTPRSIGELPPISSAAPLPASPRTPLIALKPMSSPLAVIRTALPGRSSHPVANVTPEPPLAPPRVVPTAPAPVLVSAVRNVDLGLPGISEPPGELPILKTGPAPQVRIRFVADPALVGPREYYP